MRKVLAILGLGLVCGLVPSVLQAAIITTDVSAGLTTVPNSAGGNSAATGTWFNVVSGTSTELGAIFPSPLFADGQFFLCMDTEYTQTEAEVFTQGYFSRGNGVIYQSSGNLNPARFGDGTVIGPTTGYQSPGAGFTDLGPTYGNWSAGGHGYIGLTIRNSASTLASSLYYGYAEINVNPDYSITLLSFAYNNVVGQPITTVSTVSVPEPLSASVLPIAAVAGLCRRRRRSAI